VLFEQRVKSRGRTSEKLFQRCKTWLQCREQLCRPRIVLDFRQRGLEAGEPRRRARAAQHTALERANQGSAGPRSATKRGQRVLQKRQQGHGRETLDRGARQEAQKQSRRRLQQRHTG
jgi:hypothetical protein